MNPYIKKNVTCIQANFKKHKNYVSTILSSTIRKHGYVIDDQEREDLMQIGLVNLLECLRKFDPNNGASFSTFAYTRVSGGFVDEFRKNSSIPRRQQQQYSAYRALSAKYANANEQLTLTIAAQELGVDIDTMSSMLLTWESSNKVHLDDESSFISLGNSFTDDPELITIGDNGIEVIQAEIRKLEERERVILDLYFFRELSLKDISETLGLTEGRVSQLKNRALIKIRAQLHN